MRGNGADGGGDGEAAAQQEEGADGGVHGQRLKARSRLAEVSGWFTSELGDDNLVGLRRNIWRLC